MFLGMRGTGDWVNNARPENWRQTYFMLFPNGMAPLTAVLSMMPPATTIDPRLHWWEKTFPTQRATITGAFMDAALTIPYVVSGAGTTVFFRMSQVDAERFIATDVVLFRRASDLTLDVVGRVTNVIANGANSYVSAILINADANSTATPVSTLFDCDVALIIGTANAEGSNSPDSWANDPYELWNYCQIFKQSIEHTNTALATTIRYTTNKKKDDLKEALEAYNMKIEKASILGVRAMRAGANGKPERYMGGMRQFIATNQYDYSTDPTVAGQAWALGGEAWIDNLVEAMFRWGTSTEKLVLCGAGALAAIQVLVKARGTVQLNTAPKAYGIEIATWTTIFGSLHFKTHPLFTMEPTLRHSMLFIEPKNVRHVPFRSTKLEQGIQDNDADEVKDQYIGEIGMEVYLERTHGWADNVGNDNNLAA